MPYSSIEAAKAAGAKTKLGGGELRLPQINAIAAVADALKKDPKIKEPYAVAIAQFKKGHHIEDGWWVKNKKGGTRELEAEEQELCDELLEGINEGEWSENGTTIIHRHAGPDPDNVVVLESAPPGTRTIADVELLKEGVHVDRFGHTLVVSPDKIKQIPGIYRRLVSLGFRPPVRLTHNPKHPLASGYPSLGWPDVPRAWLDPADNKWTLNSDLLGVPMKFADIMEAGGFDRISCGLYEDVKVGDYMAPLAIDHIAVLGVTHPAVTELKGISDIHKLYEHEMADRDQVEVSAAYLFEDGGLATQTQEGEAMPLSKEQLVEYGCTTEDELKAKLAKAAEADKDKEAAETAVKELEAAREKIRLGAAEGFIGTNREKFPPALDDHFRAVHMGLTERAEASVEFERPTKDGKIEKVKLDPVASLNAIVAKFGKAIELQDEKAPEGGTDQEHETEDEKKARLKAEAEKKEKEGKGEGGEDKKEGETDEAVELSRGDGIAVRTKMAVEQRTLASFIADRDKCGMGDAMSQAAIELERAGYGTDHYVPPQGLEKKDEKKDDKK